MATTMFEGWSEYYFMLGSSAAGLIGLAFVVVTLTSGRDRRTIERGQRLYMTPIVFQLGVVLVLSGAAIAPVMTPIAFSLIGAALAAVGTIAGVRVAIGIGRSSYETSYYDFWWYGVIPAVNYLLLGGASAATFVDATWAPSGVAAVVMALLLVSIHNEWDLVTYLAPRTDSEKP